MYRNLLIIIVLAGSLSGILYLKPWKNEPESFVLIQDRLPNGDLIGQTNVLTLSQSLSKTLFYYKLPFRDFISPDFLLSQGKSYGLDLQAPVYFFLNEEDHDFEELGLLLNIRDSSKVREGIEHFLKFIEIQDTTLYNTPVSFSPKERIYMAYSNDWMFIYKGDDFQKNLYRIRHAKQNDVSTRWRDFMNENCLKGRSIIAQLKTKELNDYGIESTVVSLSNDSSNFILNANIKQYDSILIDIRPTSPMFSKQEFSENTINVSLNIDRLRRHKNDPIYKAITKLSKKIHFPLAQFLDVWGGDFAFRQGGIQTIREKYVTSELDDNFNVTEVTKYKDVVVSGFSLYLSTLKENSPFLQTLFERGIMNKEDKKVRLLFSHPMNLKNTDSSMVFYTGSYTPKLYTDSTNKIMWTVNKTPVSIYLDSTDLHSLYCRVHVPLKKLIYDNLSLNESTRVNN
ncbi:MAG: hypothetical protein P8N52_02605 [Crocinitomicaceae bacterium]|nr:hypothetical protein [Crocinitomicaceae bacterium]MDG1775844.1 hypothetical protein [Crocinitomicaceae bacterium]